jgi:hypothetical protein
VYAQVSEAPDVDLRAHNLRGLVEDVNEIEYG